MPRNKDLKRLVRARMEKTGERYTAARAVVTARGKKRTSASRPSREGEDVERPAKAQRSTVEAERPAAKTERPVKAPRRTIKTERPVKADRPAAMKETPRDAGRTSATKATGHGAPAARRTAARRTLARAGAVPRDAVPRSEWPALAGMSDASVQQKTGRTWAEWVALLDGEGAHALAHRDIAERVYEEPGVSGWWSQMVAVGYERIRGLRDVGQQCDGSFEASKSRTYGVPVATLFRMFTEGRARRAWLPSGWTRVRASIPDKSLRVDWDDGTQVNFWFTSKGASKCSVGVQHAKLATKAKVADAKAYWDERLAALAEALA